MLDSHVASTRPGNLAGLWMRNNAIALAVVIILNIATFAINKEFDPEKSHPFSQFVVVAANTLLFALNIGIHSALAGQVLRIAVPALRLRTWILLHTALGALIGMATGFAELYPAPLTDQSEPLPRGWLAALLAALGAVLGALGGSFQALILRRAARRVGAWIGLGAIGCAVTFPLFALAIDFTANSSSWYEELAMESMSFIVGMVIATVMIPALYRLRPR